MAIKGKTCSLYATIPESKKQELEALATSKGYKVSQFVKLILLTYLEDNKEV